MAERRQRMGLSRGKRVAVLLSTLVFFALFFAVIAAFLAEPGATFYMGRRSSHSRILLTREQGLAYFIPAVAAGICAVVYTFWGSIRHAWKTTRPAEVVSELEPGETVLWAGKQGWRSLGGGRVGGISAILIVPSLILWWMWSIAADTDAMSVMLFRLMFPAGILFCYVLPTIVFCSDAIRSWLYEVFGSIAITRTRVAWLTPRARRVYREIPAAEVVDGYVADSYGKHGSLTVIKRRGNNNVEYVYLDGLREPERAQAAVQSLITYRSPSDTPR